MSNTKKKKKKVNDMGEEVNNGTLYYVYGHRLVETEEVFYIGFGDGDKLNSKEGRTFKWQQVAAEGEWESFIMLKDIKSEKRAYETCLFMRRSMVPRSNQRSFEIGTNTSAKGNSEQYEDSKVCLTSRVKMSKNNPKKKPVVNCRGEVFASSSDAGAAFGMSRQNVNSSLKKPNATAGKYPDGTRASWSYYVEEEPKIILTTKEKVGL